MRIAADTDTGSGGNMSQQDVDIYSAEGAVQGLALLQQSSTSR